MKKMFIYILILLTTTLTACFENEKVTGVTLDLGSLSEAIQKVHILVLSGDAVIAQKSYERDSIVDKDIYVPSGENVTFVVLGENISNLIAYCGTKTVKLSGENIKISIPTTEIVSGFLDEGYVDETVDGKTYWHVNWNHFSWIDLYRISYTPMIAVIYSEIYSGRDDNLIFEKIDTYSYAMSFYVKEIDRYSKYFGIQSAGGI